MSESYDVNLGRLRKIASEHGMALNPDPERLKKVVGLMADNHDAVGEWICPCKQQNKPPVKGADKICPCPEWLDEIKSDGKCFCKLFFAQA